MATAITPRLRSNFDHFAPRCLSLTPVCYLTDSTPTRRPKILLTGYYFILQTSTLISQALRWSYGFCRPIIAANLQRSTFLLNRIRCIWLTGLVSVLLRFYFPTTTLLVILHRYDELVVFQLSTSALKLVSLLAFTILHGSTKILNGNKNPYCQFLDSYKLKSVQINTVSVKCFSKNVVAFVEAQTVRTGTNVFYFNKTSPKEVLFECNDKSTWKTSKLCGVSGTGRRY